MKGILSRKLVQRLMQKRERGPSYPPRKPADRMIGGHYCEHWGSSFWLDDNTVTIDSADELIVWLKQARDWMVWQKRHGDPQ